MEKYQWFILLAAAAVITVIVMAEKVKNNNALEVCKLPNAYQPWTNVELVIAAYLAMYDMNRKSRLLSVLAKDMGRSEAALYTKARKIHSSVRGSRKNKREKSAYLIILGMSKWKAEKEIAAAIGEISGDGDWLFEKGYFKRLS